MTQSAEASPNLTPAARAMTAAELIQIRRDDQLDRIRRDLLVIVHDAEPDSQLAALAEAVRELTNIVSEGTFFPSSQN
jgi:hypothetical protein